MGEKVDSDSGTLTPILEVGCACEYRVDGTWVAAIIRARTRGENDTYTYSISNTEGPLPRAWVDGKARKDLRLKFQREEICEMYDTAQKIWVLVQVTQVNGDGTYTVRTEKHQYTSVSHMLLRPDFNYEETASSTELDLVDDETLRMDPYDGQM